MKKCIYCFLLILAACGGGNGSVSQPPPPPPQQSASGIWTGTITSNVAGQSQSLIGLVTETSEVYFFTSTSGNFIGTGSVNGDQFSGTLMGFAPTGFTWPDGSAIAQFTMSGTVTTRIRISGTYSGGGDSGTFTVLYDSTYERPSSLPTMSGLWATDPNAFGGTAELTIDPLGLAFGSNTVGCVFNAIVSIRNASFNYYQIDLIVTSCGVFTGSYSGLGVLTDTFVFNDTIIFQLSNVNFAFTLELFQFVAQGVVFINNDEWTFLEQGFINAPDARLFVKNMAAFFSRGKSGKFHLFSGWLGDLSLTTAFSDAGHTLTRGFSIPFDLPTLMTFDGVLVGGDAVDNTVLVDYVNAGGNVYIAGGTGIVSAAAEAARWDSFLNPFGFQFEPIYNGIDGNIVINTTHPIFHSIGSLFMSNGSSITDLAPSDPRNEILVSSGGQGLWAIYDPNN